MLKVTASAVALILLAACQAENRSGLPETETTGTAQSVQETSTASATTTGESGGTLSAMTPADKEFVVKAGMGGLYEVQAGNLALQNASSPAVRSFAQRVVTDHSKANAELAQLATAKGVALATELTGEHEAAVDHLATLSGAEFDKAYMQHMVADHAKDVAEFEKASTSATDADLKGWAGRTLPILREHAKLANELAGKV
ncbi:MAG TPA: DUF4142 domain-containing protein [Thermoanaerobaculia bacterium]|jgi:putative membrane protein|nr:DUF4142 domain-containing protein [Thermoanaerobaculia bacterium]